MSFVLILIFFRDSRDSNFSDANNSYYDDALIAAAKAFLLQNTSASSNGNDDHSNTSFLNALIQNPQAMQQVAEVLNAQSTPTTQEQNPSNSVIKTEQPDVETAEDDAGSSMPVFEISNLTANSQDSAIFDSRESTLLSLQEVFCVNYSLFKPIFSRPSWIQNQQIAVPINGSIWVALPMKLIC